MTTRPLALALLSLAAIAASAAPALADCRRSASGTRSAEISLSPRSGILCVKDVAVFTGPSCEGEPQYRFSASCGEMLSAVITDDGHFVSLLARRASRRGWNIVLITSPRDGAVQRRRITFGDLPGVPPERRPGRVRLDDGGLTLEGDPEIVIPLAELIRGRP